MSIRCVKFLSLNLCAVPLGRWLLGVRQGPDIGVKWGVIAIAKPIFRRVMTWVFYDEIVKSAEFCSSYFNRTKLLMVLGLVGTNIFLGSMVSVFQQALREFVHRGAAAQNENEINEYYKARWTLLTVIFFIAAVYGVNAVLTKKLRDDLTFEVRGYLTNCQQKGIQTEVVNPAANITYTTKQLCDHLINLANDRLSTLSHFAGALYSLYLNSEWIPIFLLGLSFEVPYLILVCFTYIILYNVLSSWANAIFKKNTEEETLKLNSLSSKLNLINDFNNEEECKKINQEIHAINRRSLLPQYGLSFLNKINQNISMVIGAGVQFSTGGGVAEIMTTSQNFSYAAVQASWHRMQLEQLKKLETALQIIKALHEDIIKKDVEVVVKT